MTFSDRGYDPVFSAHDRTKPEQDIAMDIRHFVYPSRLRRIIALVTQNILSQWTAVILPILLAFVGIAALITTNIINARNEAEILSLKPRDVTEAQANDLAPRLQGIRGNIGFISQLMNRESADYGQKLSAVFQRAHWNIAPSLRTSLNDLPGYVVPVATNRVLLAPCRYHHQRVERSWHRLPKGNNQTR